MAQRTLKIGLSSSLVNTPADVTIWVNDQIIQNNISVSNAPSNPLVIEHTIDDVNETLYVLKFQLNNDSFSENMDLNLIINYLTLSDENNLFTPYTYLTNNTIRNLRSSDGSYLLLGTVWSNFVPYEISFNLNNLLTWFDAYQYNIDNPPQDGSTII